MFDGKRILITGGTGTFGENFTKHLLKFYSPEKIIIFSRDEMKQWSLEEKLKDKRLRFMLGDVRDKDRIRRALNGIDYVVHAAAMKIVPKAEYDPFECIKTNVLGAMNIIDACIDSKVKKVVALSTDKASSPINVYGASKLLSDKVFSAANNYAGMQNTIFTVVRYGNVMGSRGSVIPYFQKLRNEQKLPITDLRMTRFMITIDEGIELVKTAFQTCRGGEIFVKKVPSMKIVDIAKSINSKAKFDIIGIRPGEKIHEQLISSDEAKYTYDYGNYYVIYSPYSVPDKRSLANDKATKVNDDFSYCSGTNSTWMTQNQLTKWLHENNMGV